MWNIVISPPLGEKTSCLSMSLHSKQTFVKQMVAAQILVKLFVAYLYNQLKVAHFLQGYFSEHTARSACLQVR